MTDLMGERKMRIMSCNVVGGLKNLWPASLEVISSCNADLIGFQELYWDQKEYYLASMPEFQDFCILDRPDVSRALPTNGIFFRRDRFRLLSSGGHWLSETPHVCGSTSWGSRCIRLLNWVVLEDLQTGRALAHFNTHLDHVSQEARERQAGMLNESAAVYPDMPCILTGDMNAALDNAAIGVLTEDGWRDSYFEANGDVCHDISWHGLEGDACQRAQDVPGNEKGKGRIDWIFLKGSVAATGAGIIKKKASDGNFPSDHYFVYADVEE